ncbi:hypothetical protein Hypma_016388 [Hypsizygus marmoreus]|uniref:Uncharacterized protein n=1 Tax=Hypsizygus marmoreus TaxID=39966 RepID=A0A369IYA2_HYPMA|nr:hypothetical protein Hypma_016388 [Hypsizygus marmoreus]
MDSARPIAVPAVAKTAPVSTQPKADSMKMSPLGRSTSTQSSQVHHEHAQRLRGGGAAKDCFLGLCACFICFECCEGLCDCCANILCCPCEMCC